MGTTCLIDYDYDVDSETLAKDAMATEQILVVPGDYFDMPKTIRVGYGAFRDPQVLKAGLEAGAGWFIVEQDQWYDANPLDDAKKSIDTITGLNIL